MNAESLQLPGNGPWTGCGTTEISVVAFNSDSQSEAAYYRLAVDCLPTPTVNILVSRGVLSGDGHTIVDRVTSVTSEPAIDALTLAQQADGSAVFVVEVPGSYTITITTASGLVFIRRIEVVAGEPIELRIVHIDQAPLTLPPAGHPVAARFDVHTIVNMHASALALLSGMLALFALHVASRQR